MHTSSQTFVQMEEIVLFSGPQPIHNLTSFYPQYHADVLLRSYKLVKSEIIPLNFSIDHNDHTTRKYKQRRHQKQLSSNLAKVTNGTLALPENKIMTAAVLVCSTAARVQCHIVV